MQIVTTENEIVLNDLLTYIFICMKRIVLFLFYNELIYKTFLINKCNYHKREVDCII